MNWLDNIGQDTPEDNTTEVLNIEASEYSEWELERLGRFTSSRIGDLMTKGRSKDKFWGDTAMNYIYEKLGELLTGVPHYIAETRAMQWGTENEPFAIEAYNKVSKVKAEHMGKTFIQFTDMCGGSPDGYVGKDGVLEVKCPYNSANHIKTYITREIPKNYIYQCQGNMLFTDRSWCDFISFDPRMPEELQLVVIRVNRDEDICDAILERIEKATEKIKEIQELTGVELKINF